MVAMNMITACQVFTKLKSVVIEKALEKVLLTVSNPAM